MNLHGFKLNRPYSVSSDLSNVGAISPGLNTKGPYLSSEKEKENSCVAFTYSIKQAREIRKCHVVVVQRKLSKVVVLLI